MPPQFTIRVATAQDAPACAAIYAPYVTGTTITFETEVPSAADFVTRIDDANAGHVWLVLEEDGVITGYAYGGKFHRRAAYRWACESSVYLDMNVRGSGRGRALYTELIRRLRQRGYRRVVGIITQPNEPSMRLHRALGFTEVGTFRRVGWKLDAWRDVAWVGLDLAPDEDPTEAPAELH